MLIVDNLLAKRKRATALRRLRDLIVADSVATIKNNDNDHVIEDFKASKMDSTTFIFYPIALNKTTKYTQYIHAALSKDRKVTTPLSWETIEFIKANLSSDLEELHDLGFKTFNNGQSTRPFELCYSIVSLDWN